MYNDRIFIKGDITMQETIIDLMNGYGYLGILFLIMIENIFPPIPSEIILGVGGYMTKTTNLTLFGIVLVSTIGSCLGALILYYLGRIINKEKLISLTDNHLGKILQINASDIEKANQWFLAKGSKTILFGRFVPVIRSLISIPAGISQMSLVKFIILTAIGTFIWNGILTITGSILGTHWYKIGIFMKKYSLIVIIGTIIIIIIIILSWLKKRKD